MLVFFLSKTRSPRPAFENNPAIAAPKLIVPLISIIVKAIDTAQLGINPSTPVTTGSSILYLKLVFVKNALITESVTKEFKNSVITSTKAKTFTV